MSYEKPESAKKCEENLEIKDFGSGEWKQWTIERVFEQMMFYDNVKVREK